MRLSSLKLLLVKLLIKIPYSMAWRLTNASNNAFPIVYYCSDYQEYSDIKPILNHHPNISVVAKSRNLQNTLFEKRISSILWPVYPRVVIMHQNFSYLFPSKKVLKIIVHKDKSNTSSPKNSNKLNCIFIDLFDENSIMEISKIIERYS